MAGAATMVVIWGNILSFIGNVVALAVEVLVFNAFFPRNENRKSQWLCILLWWAIATFLSISVGTKFGYTLTMLQEVALIYLFCVFLYQSLLLFYRFFFFINLINNCTWRLNGGCSR